MDSSAYGYINIHGESPGKGKAQQKQDWRCKICQHVLEAATIKGMGWKMLKLGLERRLEENSKVCQMFLSVSQVSSIRERSHYLKASWVISAPFCLTSTLSRLLWCLGTQVYNWSSGPEFVLSMILMTFE